MVEEWRPIPGYSQKYEISNFGRVRSFGHRLLKARKDRGGYVFFALSNQSKWKKNWAHRLVIAAFKGNAPSPKHEVNHIDSDRANNTPENLEWVTRLENARHREKYGKSCRHEGNGNAKLTWPLVRAIRGLLAQGNTQKHLAAKFGVSKQMISEIHRNNFWVEEAA